MADLSQKRVSVSKQVGSQRILNFEEIEIGYTKEQAMEEAKRCLQCKTKPCVRNCPVHVHIPEFIAKVANGCFEEAYQLIRQSSSLPEVCGRLCPQEKQCEGHCVRGIKGESIAIGRLERFIADYHLLHTQASIVENNTSQHKVAIIGSGPAGLGCAQTLIDLGYQVTVLEAMHTIGGVLMYGIPQYRLPKTILEQRILHLKQQGVVFQTGIQVGKDISIDEMRKEYIAIFIGCGAGISNHLTLSSGHIQGIYDANSFLKICNLDEDNMRKKRLELQSKHHIVIIGGGNVAMDVSRCAKRLGIEEVSIVYRRSMDELPARKEEITEAIEEGISFCLLTNPLQAIANDKGEIQALECIQMELGDPDESGRRPQVVEGSNFIMKVDALVVAIGSSVDPLLKLTTPELEVNEKGNIVTNENLQTSIPGIFAGGDAVTGPETVVKAMGAGIQAAHQIDLYIKQNIDTKG